MAEQFFIYMRGAFDTLYAEAAEAPRMLIVAVHGRLIGRPGRIGGPVRVLDQGPRPRRRLDLPPRHRAPLDHALPLRGKLGKSRRSVYPLGYND